MNGILIVIVVLCAGVYLYITMKTNRKDAPSHIVNLIDLTIDDLRRTAGAVLPSTYKVNGKKVFRLRFDRRTIDSAVLRMWLEPTYHKAVMALLEKDPAIKAFSLDTWNFEIRVRL